MTPVPRKLAPAAPDEVTLYELGESLALSIGRVEAELARQGGETGHRLDGFEVRLPVSLRVDDLGQPLVRADGQGTPGGASLTLRFRPRTPDEPAGRPPTDQPLAALRVLSPKAEAALRARRVNSVQDLARIAQTPGGREALRRIGLGTSLDRLLDRADVLSLPVPSKVSAALLRAGVASPAGFKRAGTERLATSLTRLLGKRVTAEQVTAWKALAAGGPVPPAPALRGDGTPPVTHRVGLNLDAGAGPHSDPMSLEDTT